MDKIVDFITQNNQNLLGSTTLLPISLLKSIIEWGSSPLTIEEDHRLIGTVIPIPIPLRSFDLNLNSYNLTYLCVAKSSRNRGVTHQLIKKITESVGPSPIGYSIGIKNNFPTTFASIPIGLWYRPLKCEIARSFGYEFPSFRRPNDRSDFRDRLIYSTNVDNNIKINKLKNREGFEEYLQFTQLAKLRFNPSIDQWARWIRSFPTFEIRRNNEIIGIFTLISISSLINGKNINLDFIVLSSVRSLDFTKDLLRAAIHIAAQNGSIVLYGYRVGHIGSEDIKSIHGSMTRNPIYLTFHCKDNQFDNLKNLKEMEVYLPLI